MTPEGAKAIALQLITRLDGYEHGQKFTLTSLAEEALGAYAPGDSKTGCPDKFGETQLGLDDILGVVKKELLETQSDSFFIDQSMNEIDGNYYLIRLDGLLKEFENAEEVDGLDIPVDIRSKDTVIECIHPSRGVFRYLIHLPKDSYHAIEADPRLAIFIYGVTGTTKVEPSGEISFGQMRDLTLSHDNSLEEIRIQNESEEETTVYVVVTPDQNFGEYKFYEQNDSCQTKPKIKKIAGELYNTLMTLPDGSMFSMGSLAKDTYGEFSRRRRWLRTHDTYGGRVIEYEDLLGQIRYEMFKLISFKKYALDNSRTGYMFLGRDVQPRIRLWKNVIEQFQNVQAKEFNEVNAVVKGTVPLAKGITSEDKYRELLIDFPPKAEIIFNLGLYQAVFVWPIDGTIHYESTTYKHSYCEDGPPRTRKFINEGKVTKLNRVSSYSEHETRYQDTFNISNKYKTKTVKLFMIIRPKYKKGKQ